jgi:hypothetical protein
MSGFDNPNRFGWTSDDPPELITPEQLEKLRKEHGKAMQPMPEKPDAEPLKVKTGNKTVTVHTHKE